MKNFFSIDDVGDPEPLVQEALRSKYAPNSDNTLGKNRSVCLIFFNPSLRTRLSSIKAAENLGMNVSVFSIGSEGWKLEFEEGVIMEGDKAEHIKDAAAVIGSYFDIIGIRSFPALQNKEEDYSEKILNAFIKYSGVPIVNLESCTLHPLQSLADLITIRENSGSGRPKVVLTWAPHIKALPQAVPNSFAQWMNAANVDLTIVQPEGMELDPVYSGNARISYDQSEAFEGADYIYAKNWSSVSHYGKLHTDRSWIIDAKKMSVTNNGKFMHCLPVRRNLVVTDEVLDGGNSLVIEQAFNRVWAAQIIFKKLLLG